MVRIIAHNDIHSNVHLLSTPDGINQISEIHYLIGLLLTDLKKNLFNQK